MTKAREIADLGSSATSLDTVGSNLIINGAHTVDQRNSGSSANVTNGADHFIADRFRFSENSSATFSAQQVSDAPAGFEKSSKITVTGTDSSLAATEFHRILQPIEGSNISHLNWGSSNAKTLTLTFHVKSSLTGQFYVFAFNSAANRTFLSGYTIDSADTWEKKTITITGDTSGTWLTTTGAGIYLGWSLGTGSTYQSSTLDAFQAGFYMAKSDQVNFGATNSATWQLTGCQLEVGSATDFEHRSYADQLQACQRYYFQVNGDSSDRVGIGGYAVGASEARMDVVFPCAMRAAPTISGTGTAQFDANTDSADFNVSAMIIDEAPTGIISGLGIQIASSSMVAGQSGGFRFRSTGTLSFSAEL